MAKEHIDMVAMTTRKANYQNFTCFIAFITTAFLSVAMMLTACVLPIMVKEVTATICWISMALEAASICVGYTSLWIKRNAL